MRTVQSYLSWLIPTLTSNPEWLAFMTAVSEELVDLHQRQMGTSDYRGFSGVNLINNGDFSTEDKWRSYIGAYVPHKSHSTGEWEVDVDTGSAGIATGSTGSASTLVRFLPNVFLEQTYTLTYTVDSVSGTTVNLLLLPPDDGVALELPTTAGTHSFAFRLSDYYIGFLAIYSVDAAFSISNIQLVEGI